MRIHHPGPFGLGLRCLTVEVSLLVAGASLALAQIVPMAEAGNCAQCVTCTELGKEGHKDVEDPDGDYDKVGHPCFGGISCLGHGRSLCQGFASIESPQVTLYAAIERAADGSASAVAALVRQFPNRVSVNTARGALQVTGCGGETMVAHIPLDAETLAVAELASETFAVGLR